MYMYIKLINYNTHNAVTSQVSYIHTAQSAPIGLEPPHHYCLIPINGS